MYRVCINCPKLGVSCDGGNLLTMPPQELLEWMRLRKKVRGLSVHTIAILSGVPEGTVARVFAPDAKADFRVETLRPIICVLIGGELGQNPCPDPADESSATWLRDQIIYRDGVIADLRTRLSDTEREHHDTIADLRATLTEERSNTTYYRGKADTLRRIVWGLASVLTITLILIAIFFTHDIMNGHLGWIRF